MLHTPVFSISILPDWTWIDNVTSMIQGCAVTPLSFSSSFERIWLQACPDSGDYGCHADIRELRVPFEMIFPQQYVGRTFINENSEGIEEQRENQIEHS